MRGGLRVWLVALVLLAAGGTFAGEAQPLAANPAVEKRLVAISENLRCLVCQNESLAASRADLAEDLRREVRELIVAGKSDQEIIDFLVARYGDYVLYDPPFKATTLLLWLGPFAALLGGLGGLVFYLRRRSRRVDGVAEAGRQGAWQQEADPSEASVLYPVRPEPVEGQERSVAKPPALRGRALLLALLIAIPLGAVAVYFKVGNPQALNPDNLRPRPDPEAMVARLAARLEANPNDPGGWALLARAYMVMNRPADARKAFEHILPDVKKDPKMTAAYAETLAAVGDLKAAQNWVDAALKRGSPDPQLVFLAGGLAFTQNHYATAIRYWEQVLKTMPPDSDEARFVQENIKEARARLK